VDDDRSVDADEAIARELLGDGLHGVAHEVRAPAPVELHVVPLCVHPLDVLRADRIQVRWSPHEEALGVRGGVRNVSRTFRAAESDLPSSSRPSRDSARASACSSRRVSNGLSR
jgi:hypothetical protein